MTENDIYCILHYDKYIFVGTYDGVYLSKNNAETWNLIYDEASVESMIILNNSIFIGTGCCSVLKADINEIINLKN
jgi:hypothetical protein